MSVPRRGRRALAVLALLPVSLAVLIIDGTGAGAESQLVANACKSNATGTYSDIDWTLSGTAVPNPATVGTDPTVTLSGSNIQGFIPADLLIAGYNLGLLVKGVNNIPSELTVLRAATNVDSDGDATTTGDAGTYYQADTVSFIATTTITDETATGGTVTATPIDVNQPLPDMVVIPTGGNIEFRQADPAERNLAAMLDIKGMSVDPAGSIFTSSDAGLPRGINFDCQPGVASADGSGSSPAGSWPAFETVVVPGGSGSSTTTTTTSTTSTSTTTSTTSTTSTTTTTVPGATTVSGTATYTTTCSNNVTQDLSELTFTITATAPTEVQAGDTVRLSDQSWKMTVPGSVLQAGIGLGLIAPGDTVQGTVTPAVFASNTTEGSRTGAPVSVAIGPVEVLGETAQAASTTFDVADMEWTTVGGTVGYALEATTVEVTIGPLKVVFSCQVDDLTLAVVETQVLGDSGQPPASRPAGGGTTVTTAPTEVLGSETERSGELPRTGLETFALVGLAFGLIDLGYLARSATKPQRRRGAN